ncbi:Tripartite motif-containing protein 59 [Holothuria leucospilota]|uniref:Tripartite motif-containing protein 59 n=1 Tax=Holothuria leucospilota TaxID=206669 RepID=A0A9Q1CQS3_HOLLE|nr:Tripartite motif-containing protein 59 [Holothuria leucospilota]
MATAEASSPAEWKIMKQPFYSCSICFEEDVKPKMLPCGHTFCESCLENILLQRREFKTTFPCPMCKNIVELPTSGSVGDFPTNYSLLDVIESTQLKNLCPKHKKSQDLFCVTCDKCICVECFQESHKPGVSPVAHDVTSATVPANMILKRLQSLARKLQDSKHKELLDRLSTLEEQQAQDLDQIKEQIKYQKEQMIRQIEGQAEDLVKAAEIFAKEKKESLDNIKNKLKREHTEQTGRAKTFLSLAEEIRTGYTVLILS